MRVALFDMDKTLVRCNTMGRFLQHEYREGRIGKLQMLSVLLWQLQYRWGLLPAQQAAERIMSWYAGHTVEFQRQNIRVWFERQIAREISAGARAAVERHRAAGDRLVLVSVTHELICDEVAGRLGIDDVLCTRLEMRGQELTGALLPPLCYGPNKVLSVAEFLAREGYTWADTIAYSDSIADLPLLQAAHTAVAINPDARLARHARLQHWRIERW